MSRRPLSDLHRGWLTAELQFWIEQQLISPEQMSGILSCYESTAETSDRKRSFAQIVLVSVAAFLFGVALLLLMGYNWQALPTSFKLLTIFGFVGGAHSGGFALYRKDRKRLAECMFFLGCLLYGAAIFLVAQIFHIEAHYPNGVLWWALGVLPFALLLDTLLMHLLVVALLALWVGMEVIGFSHLGGWFFGRWMALPNSALQLPFLAGLGLLWGYRKGSTQTVGLYVALFSWWALLQPVALRVEANPVFYIGAIGAVLIAFAECHRAGSRFAIPYRFVGVFVIACALIPLSYYDFNENTFPHNGGLKQSAVLLIGILFAGAVAFLWANFQRQQHGEDLESLVRREVVPIGMLAGMVLLSLWEIALDESLLPTILANAGMIALSLWLMQVGLRDNRLQPFGAGVAYLLLWILLRYFDLFGNFGGMLGAALMFFLCGAGLLGIAYAWRKRKEIFHV